MTKKGAEFSPVRPLNDQGRIRATGTGSAGTVALSPVQGLEYGTIVRVSDFNAFRPGQQVQFWLTVYNGVADQSPLLRYFSRVRLKPWWLRPNNEYRAPGGPGVDGQPAWLGIDEQTFSGGTADNNRRVWFPEVTPLAQTPYGTTPPPVAVTNHVDLLLMQRVWVIDELPAPTDASYAGTLLPGQVALGVSRTFEWIARGYALGFTWDAVSVGQQGSPLLTIDLNWITGAL